MSDLDIAIVIVTYKSAALTVQCLRSIAAERTSPGLAIRAVVVDNASGDLPEIERAIQANGWDGWVSVVAAPRNGGFAYGNNLGIEHACRRAPPAYVHLLNPDTQVRPGAIGILVRFLEAHPEAGIAGSSFENLDGSAWPISFRFPSLFSEIDTGLQLGLATRVLKRWVVARPMSQELAQPVDWICGASMLIRPAVLSALGGFDENYFLYYEETDFCLRAARAGFATWYVPQSRVMHIAGQSTHVTERQNAPKRLPAYWFESRRRYFAISHGVLKAMAIDLAALLAHALGSLKRNALGRRAEAVPFFIRDLLRHSILWPAHRSFPPARGLKQIP
ncbi:MAG TPA: glycosyltransferase family 2 protein [Steroidobacteraceae bacterium]|nr:glycosyltransferase family 2 protein [Steroidobacteraceae bacterium]